MKKVLGAALLMMVSSQALASLILVEDFEDEFPAWESRWLGTNSNIQNYYGLGEGRGNNPDGLWIDDGDGVYGADTVEIVFGSAFASSI